MLFSVLFIGLVNAVLSLMRNIPYTVYSRFPIVDGCWSAQLPFMVGAVSDSSAITSLASILAQDVLVLILTWVRTYQVRKFAIFTDIKPRLWSLVLRDGTTYFGMILAVNVVGMVAYMDQNMPLGAAYGMQLITGMMQPLLLSRFMFGLREAYQSDRVSSSISSGYLSSVRFTSTVVGNIGAPLTNDGSPHDWNPLPVTCDDPFTIDLIQENVVEIAGTPEEARTSDTEPTARFLLGVAPRNGLAQFEIL